jgi:hypothetical protein
MQKYHALFWTSQKSKLVVLETQSTNISKTYYVYFVYLVKFNNHSYDILGARMLWKPKEARILKNFKKNYRSTSVIW